MRRLLAVLLLAASAYAADKDYPLTVTITETSSSEQLRSGKSSATTDCTTDSLGKTNCDTVGRSGSRTVTVLRQSANVSDGNTYTLQCVPSGWRAFSAGFAAATSDITSEGCTIIPGQYRARRSRAGFRIAFKDDKGKTREIAFSIVSVKKRDDLTHSQ
jgi:hypothetical protein